jgi:hypothetical protein
MIEMIVQVDLTGSSIGSAVVIFQIEPMWYGFLHAPAMAAL